MNQRISPMKPQAPICITLVILSAALPAVASTITEEAFLSVLTEEHPAVVALGERVAAAEQARSPYVENPGFDFEREAPDGEATQSTFMLSWKPPLDGRRGLQKKAGEMALAAAESDLSWRKLGLRTELRGVYADWWRLTELEALLAAHVQDVNRLTERSERRVERGEESGLNAGRLRFAAAEMETALGVLRADLARTRAAVRVYAPDLPEDSRPVQPGLPVPPPEADPTDDKRPDALFHPQVESLRHAAEGARLEKRLAGRVLEFPELAAGWTRLSQDEASADGPVLGLTWSLPLFDRNQGERAMAARNLAVAEAQLKLTAAEAESRMAAARDAYDRLRQTALEVQEATVDATLLITGATSAFDNGETTVTDLLEALRSILSGRRAAIDLYHEALAAHRELEMSIGRPLNSGGQE